MNIYQKISKRLFDVIVSFLGGVTLLVPCLILSLIVKISSKGSPFFFQKRIGLNGEVFKIIKFRTMYLESENYGSITISEDLRITPIGKFLRNYKLDELPQLWNVFIGKMSFVGPRPDVSGYADRLEGEDEKLLKLRPGITSPASIFYKNEEELLAKQKDPKDYNDNVIWPTKVKINIDYIDNYSLVKDIGYIIITVLPSLDGIFHLMDNMKSRVSL